MPNGERRKTELSVDEGEIDIEDLIADEALRDYALKYGLHQARAYRYLSSTTTRRTRRCGMNTKDEDFVEHVFTASTHDYLLCFTEGRSYVLAEGLSSTRGFSSKSGGAHWRTSCR